MPDKEVKVIIRYSVAGKEKAREVQKTIRGLGKDVKVLSTTTEKGFRKMGFSITFIAWHFRYLGNIFDRVSKQMMRVIQDAIRTSAELQESFLSIRTAAVMYGRSAEQAMKFTRELALSGLMPLTEAANSVKNLMITGIGLPELEQFTYRYLDVAFLFTSGMDEMKKSLELVSKSILRGTLVLATDVTARTLWVETEKRLQATMGVSMKELTAYQRTLQILTTIEDKYTATLGFHRMETETTRAAISRLNTSIILMKNALGTALLPILNAVTMSLTKLTAYVEALLEALGPVVPTIVAIALVVTYFTAKLSFLIGVILSVWKIVTFMGIAMWKIYLPLLAIGAILGVATFLFLKYSGALDKTKTSMQKVDDQLQSLKDSLKDVMGTEEDAIAMDEDKRIAHERTVEDIMEDLERERSKGLWANQMAIKDLEKRLKRENEDWARYTKGRGQQGEAEGTIFENIMGGVEDLGDTVATETTKMGLNWDKLREKINRWKKEITSPTFWSELFTKLGNTFYKLGKWVWDNFLVYLTTPEFWIELGKNIKAIGKFIWDAFEAALTGLGEAISSWILGPLIESQKGLEDLQNRMLERTRELRERGEYETAQRLLRISSDLAEQQAGMYDQLAKEMTFGETLRQGIDESFRWLERKGSELGRKLWERTYGIMPPRYQFGGIVPGLRGQEVPIMAHAGERVIPAGEVTGGNITVNINSPVVREQEDINRIARAVSNVLGQRQRWSRLGSL